MWGPTEFSSTGTLRSYDGEPLLARLDGRHTLWIVGQYDEARPETA
jgi:L-proline amide hydrolase